MKMAFLLKEALFAIYFTRIILVASAHDPFGQYQVSRPLACCNNENPRFTALLSNLTNLIGSKYKTSTLRMINKNRARPEVPTLGAVHKDRGLWGRKCFVRVLLSKK